MSIDPSDNVAALHCDPATRARITSLESENEHLRKALRPFAEAAPSFAESIPEGVVADHRTGALTVGDFRAARQALEETGREP